MAFDIRCPECKAKLRLDEAPDPDTPIECPRCGSTFAAPPPDAPAKKPKADKPAKGDKPKGKMPKKKKAKKKKTNPLFLLIAIGFGFAALIGVGSALVWLANRPGAVTEMLTYVPADCNVIRGVNVGQLSRYPGYKQEVDKFFTADVKAGTDALAKAAGQDPETFVSYLVIARNRTSASSGGLMYVIRTNKTPEPGFVKAVSGAAETNVNGEPCYKMPARAGGILNGATVYNPTPRVVVIVPPAGRGQSPAAQDALLRGSVAGKGSPADSFAGKNLDETAKRAVRASMWLVVKMTGGMKDYLKATTTPVKDDFKTAHDRASKAQTFGVWTSPGGGGVQVGAGFQCGDANEASELVKSMKEGPLGKADESEPTNQLKQAMGTLTGNKKLWSEFTQYLEFRRSGECAFLVSKVTGENANPAMSIFNNPSMATGTTDTPFSDPGAGPGGPPGERGLPGGVITPGMGPP
jgi:hypothetical protein